MNYESELVTYNIPSSGYYMYPSKIKQFELKLLDDYWKFGFLSPESWETFEYEDQPF